MKRSFSTIYALFLVLISWVTLGAQQSSYLASGRWLRLSVERSGVYKVPLSRLKEYGFSHPEDIRVVGRGGRMIPEKLSLHPSDYRTFVPVWHDAEALYFYAYGPIQWRYDNRKKSYVHETHLYSTKGYYLLTENASIPARKVEPAPSDWATASAPKMGTYDYSALHEVDRVSLKMSGRLLLGESINLSKQLSVSFRLPDKPASEEHHLRVAYVALPKTSSELSVATSTASFVDPLQASEDLSISTYLAGVRHERFYPFTAPYASPDVEVSMSISPQNTPSYLDFVSFTTSLGLRYLPHTPLYFRKKGTATHATWQVENAPEDAHLWAVLPDRVVEVSPTSGGYVTPLEVGDQPIEFCMFAPKDIPEITIEGEIPTQDIFAEGVPEYVIVAPDALLHEAQRLGEYHRTDNGLKVAVLSQQQVMNEFNASTPDASAYRLLLKTIKDRQVQQTGNTDFAPLFLLFGDGAADNRKISDDWLSADLQKTEFLLTYQGVNSLNVYSYTADDFFGAIDLKNENDTVGMRPLGASIGRLPIRTPQQAKEMVDKIIAYDRNLALGDWKTRVAFVTDNKDGGSHLREAEETATFLKKTRPELNVSKLYSDSYAVKTVNGKSSIPEVRRKLMDELRKGVLMIDYVGHGGPAAWADEQILTLNDIVNFRYPHLPVWLTATCDFTNFDHPVTSAGEEAMLNPTSGAAALFTTTRVVMNLDNKNMNNQLNKFLFVAEKDGRLRRMGDVMRLAKNAMPKYDTINKLNFMLIGDPAVRLKLPPLKASILSLGGKTLSPEGYIPLKASEKVHIKGAITDPEGAVQGDFEGSLFVTIYDAEQTFYALRENGYDSGYRPSYKDYSGVVFKGLVTVKNGYFECEFVVPKDVSYGEGNGKISLYAMDPQRMWEAIGVDHSIRILPGLPDEPLNDEVPPEIRSLQLGNSSFTDGMTVSNTPLFVARIYDESGLNLSGNGIGHDMMLIIDGREDYSFVLNNYYQASLQTQGEGDVVYMLPELEEGDHTALFVVWDVANNVSRKSFTFRVEKGKDKGVLKSRIYPNPATAKEPMTIEIYNDMPGIEFGAYTELFNAQGVRVARSSEYKIETAWDAPAKITWLPQTTYGMDLAPGVYLCRITTQSQDGTWASDATTWVVVPEGL